MLDLFDTNALGSEETTIAGVVVAPVVDNIDSDRRGSVTVELPWSRPQVLEAPVLGSGAGSDRGEFWMPKKGDNVLVAFEGGDPRRPYVLGSVWMGTDLAPIAGAAAADSQRVIRTQAGQEVRIDEQADSVTIRTAAGQHVECTKTHIELKAGDGTRLRLNQDGSVVLEATKSIKLDAPTIEINAREALTLNSNAQTALKGGTLVNISAPTVSFGS